MINSMPSPLSAVRCTPIMKKIHSVSKWDVRLLITFCNSSTVVVSKSFMKIFADLNFNVSFVLESLWKKLNNSEYFVNSHPLSFASAEKVCKERLHGSMVLVTSPRRYYMLVTTLGLNTGAYWIGGNFHLYCIWLLELLLCDTYDEARFHLFFNLNSEVFKIPRYFLETPPY